MTRIQQAVWMPVALVMIVLKASAEEPKTNALVPSTNIAAPGIVMMTATNVSVALSLAAVTNLAPVVVGKLPVSPDPMVGKALMSLASHLQTSRTFRCDVSFLINSEMEGMKQEISATYALAVEKPNRLALRYVRGMAGNNVICNGTNLVIHAVSLNRYQETEAPKTFEQFAQGVGPMSGNMLFADNLIREDIYASIMEGVIKVSYAGRDTVEGVECDHLKFTQEQFDWELWLTPGLKPVVVQVLNDLSKGLGSTVGEGASPKGMRMTVLNRFSNWVVEGPLPAGTFEFKPPAGARKADALFDSDDEGPDRSSPIMPEEGGTSNRMEQAK
jgi:hypothetical protein